MHRIAWIGLIILIFVIGFTGGSRGKVHPPGKVVSAEPLQTSIEDKKPWKKKEYLIRPLAKFSMTGLVLLVDRYSWDRESEISPLDITFGWGPMSDSAILSSLTLSHGIRHYNWSARELPIDATEINKHAANMHIIPADNYTELAFNKVVPGDVLSLDGYLVEVASPDGFQWRSSLTREDSGQGACEVIWVERVRIE